MFAQVTTVAFEGIEAKPVDVQVQIAPGMPAFTLVGLPDKAVAESRERVMRARALQAERLAAAGNPRARTNAECDGALLEEIAAPDKAGMALLREAADSLRLSARGYHRTLRVARTIADLDGDEGVRRVHVAEALSYRRETLQRQVAA